MKRLLMVLTIAAALLIIPMAVFADSPGDNPRNAWNANRTIYYDASGQPTKGLFKAQMSDGVGALFYAGDDGKVVKTPGRVRVDGSKKRFLRSKDSEGHWGFREVSSSDNNPYSYFIGNNGQGAIAEDSKFYKCSAGTYFVQTNGTVRTSAGFIDVSGKRYYVRKGGLIRKTGGWLKFNGKKYYLNSKGIVRTKQGAFSVNGRRYVIKSDGSVCTKVGPVKANGVLYYVRNDKGMLGLYKAYKRGNKVYHVNKYGIIKTGRHKWKNGKYYYSVDKGYLKTQTGMAKDTEKGVRFFVEKGGLIVVNQKFKYNNRYYIAKKNGTLLTGLFNWRGTLYYANDAGALKLKPGIVQVEGNNYYVAAGGAVYVNQKFWGDGNLYIADGDGHLLSDFFYWGGYRHYAGANNCVYHSKMFTVGGKSYVADSKSNIVTGVYRWGGIYYYADTNGAISTTAGIIQYNGKRYYNNSGGGMSKNTWLNINGKHYYAGGNAAFKTGTFKYNGVKVKAASNGVISEEEYNKAMKGPDNGDSN